MTNLQEIRVENHKLVAQAFNDPEIPGDPIILLHGISGSLELWQLEQLGSIVSRGPCYAITLPGHYPAVFPSDYDEDIISPNMMAKVLIGAINQLVGDQPVTLIGHSTGGFAALCIAANAPKQIKQLISISGFARGQWHGIFGLSQWWVRRGWFGKAVFRGAYTINRMNRGFQAFSWRYYVADPSKFLADPDFKALHDAFYPDLKRIDSQAMIAYFSAMPDINISRWLPRIKTRALFITGTQDPIVPPTESIRISKLVHNSDLVMIEDCGHLPHMEKPDEFNQVVAKWLANGNG